MKSKRDELELPYFESELQIQLCVALKFKWLSHPGLMVNYLETSVITVFDSVIPPLDRKHHLK